MQNKTLHPELIALKPALIIFDKDGTLIDFHSMWGQWARDLARRLEAATYLPLAADIFKAFDFDPDTGVIAPDGALALEPGSKLQDILRDVLVSAGVSPSAIEAALNTAWVAPDSVVEAKPLTDLITFFQTLRMHGLKIAIATADDYAPTVSLVENWELTNLVDMIMGADSGVPIKPKPDVVLHICQELGISPKQTVMVGDNIVDLQMGQAAGVSLTVGVLSGLCKVDDLAPYANFVLPDISTLIQDKNN